MDLYTLDPILLRRRKLIEKYESVIWTERFSAYGELELIVKSTKENRAFFQAGLWLATSQSERVMIIDYIEDKLDEDGAATLLVKGSSLERLLEGRGARLTMSSEAVWPNNPWYIYERPGTIMRRIVDYVCCVGVVSSEDIIPMLQVTQWSWDNPPSWGLEPQDHISWTERSADNVYDAIKKIGDAYILGFKLVRVEADPNYLHFEVVPGWDRTSAQNDRTKIIFSPDFNTLQNTSELTSTQLLKNVAYVVSSKLNKIVFAPGVSPTISGFDRRVLMVDVGDVGEPPNAGEKPDPDKPELGFPPEDAGMEGRALWDQWYADEMAAWEADRQAQWDAWAAENQSLSDTWYAEIDAMLLDKGLEELVKHKLVSVYDGEINPYEGYTYGKDYELGDLVELRTDDGDIKVKRITEQIFVSDAEGDRAYPTLSELDEIT